MIFYFFERIVKCAGDKRGHTGATSTGSLVACMVEWVEMMCDAMAPARLARRRAGCAFSSHDGQTFHDRPASPRLMTVRERERERERERAIANLS